jgi:cytochrome c peroxidase
VARPGKQEAGRLELAVRPARNGSLYGLLFVTLLSLSVYVVAAGAADDAAASRTQPSASTYQWNLPRGFPPPAVPTDNPMSAQKVELGRRLFREQHLSVTGKYACINCHQPGRAFTDGRARALGATNDETRRSAMSLTNVAYNPAFTWADQTVTTLETQMLQPLLNEHPIEMGLKGREDEVVQWLSSIVSYRQLFADAFGDDPEPVSISNLIKAIAAYERTLISGRSAFDRYVFDDEQSALSASAKRGMALFYSARIGCAQCHSGVNFSGPMRFKTREHASAIFVNSGLYSVDGRGAYPIGDRGLFEVTHKRSDMGKFRVPSLRNIALTAPYMHDGSIATLSEVIDHYTEGGRQLPGGPSAKNHLVDRRIRAFQLTAVEKDDLIAFLENLTDPQFVDTP